MLARFIMVYTCAIGLVQMWTTLSPANAWRVSGPSPSQVRMREGLLIGKRPLAGLRCCAIHIHQGPRKLLKLCVQSGQRPCACSLRAFEVSPLPPPALGYRSSSGYCKPSLCGGYGSAWGTNIFLLLWILLCTLRSVDISGAASFSSSIALILRRRRRRPVQSSRWLWPGPGKRPSLMLRWLIGGSREPQGLAEVNPWLEPACRRKLLWELGSRVERQWRPCWRRGLHVV